MQVTVIGSGFVGVVTAAALSSFGNTVFGLDILPDKVASLNSGSVPFFEPGLQELLTTELASGRLQFTSDYAQAIPGSQVIMVAVGTPSAPDGTADLTYVRAACESLAPYLADGAVVCIKSTVPPGTLEDVEQRMRPLAKVSFSLASLPEFLREGTAVADTLKPSRVVIGCQDAAAIERLKTLHAPFGAPVVVVTPESAQMGKYAANAYLATRITFINQIADLCEENGANVEEVIRIIGADERIGTHYWYPGLGYGGSCFPKDVKELAAYSRSIGHGQNLFNKVNDLNNERVYAKLDQYEKAIGGWEEKTVAVLGLSFKKNTDDMREAPSTKVIPHLLHKGASVIGCDPLALDGARRFFGELPGLAFTENISEAVTQAQVVMLLVEWDQFVAYAYTQHAGAGRWFIDTRNQLDHSALHEAGWRVIGTGMQTL